MNWAEIGTQIILAIIGVVFSGLGVMFTYLINKYIKNDKVKAIINSLHELVHNSVLEVYQTYVEALKKDGMFDKAAQEYALNRCLEIINTNMPADVKQWLDENIGDITAYLQSLIEAQIATLKNNARK